MQEKAVPGFVFVFCAGDRYVYDRPDTLPLSQISSPHQSTQAIKGSI